VPLDAVAWTIVRPVARTLMSPRRLTAALAAPFLLTPFATGAETIGGNPGPQYNYVCPHADGAGPLDCYFDAVAHLYTMCRNVKSIEIIEFGYEKSEEGTNGAKYEYCVDKQKLNITRPYQAALKEASISKQAVEMLRGLQEAWLNSLVQLKWKPGESDADYKLRVVKPYDDFKERIEGIRKVVGVVQANTTPAPAAASDAAPAKKGKKQ
jgi:hypothetical protein